MIKHPLKAKEAIDYLSFICRMLKLQRVDSYLEGNCLVIHDEHLPRHLLKFGFNFVSFGIHGIMSFYRNKKGDELYIVDSVPNSLPKGKYLLYMVTLKNVKSIEYHIDACTRIFADVKAALPTYTDVSALISEWSAILSIGNVGILSISTLKSILLDLGTLEVESDDTLVTTSDAAIRICHSDMVRLHYVGQE